MDWLEKTRELLGESLDTLEEGSWDNAKAKWGDESITTIEQFKKLAKANQFQGNEKNIDWWVKNSNFQDFKTKVNDVSNKGSKTKQKKIISNSIPNGVKLLGSVGTNKAYQLITYEGAKSFRNFRGLNARWCISSNDSIHWFDYQNREFPTTFIVIVRNELKGDNYDMMCLEYSHESKHIQTFWDVDNSDVEEYNVSDLPDDVRVSVNDLSSFNINEDIPQMEFDIKWCLSKGATYTKRYDSTFDIKGSVDLSKINETLEYFFCPIEFNEVSGDFKVSDGQEFYVDDWDFLPKVIGGDLDLSHIHIENYEITIDDIKSKVNGKIIV